jgi:hypothetical protein
MSGKERYLYPNDDLGYSDLWRVLVIDTYATEPTFHICRLVEFPLPAQRPLEQCIKATRILDVEQLTGFIMLMLQLELENGFHIRAAEYNYLRKSCNRVSL